MSKVETSQGSWLVAIHSVAEAEGGDVLLLKLILEQAIDEERFCTRELGVQGPAATLRDPESLGEVEDRIRRWIETTEEDGYLNLGRTG
jgi:hypothetical protein